MSKDFTITVRADCERGELFERVFGSRTVAVVSPFPHRAVLPGRGGSLVYELDLELIDDEQRKRMVEHVARKFGFAVEVVDALLDREGMPILAEDVCAAVANPQKWF